MSTITYRDGYMVADSKAYSGYDSAIMAGTKCKAHRLADGSLLGIVSGEVGAPDRLKRDVEAGLGFLKEFRSPFEATALIVRPDGSVWYYHEGLNFTGPVEQDYFAIGSGAKFAFGALHQGATAAEAIATACRFDPNSALPMTVVALKKGKR